MRWRDYLVLAALGFLSALAVGMFQSSPGYMDADYYFSNGQRLAGGYGFSELLIWNFLDDPQQLPHPSHSYWMPLASMVTWMGMALAGSDSFNSGRSMFLLLAGLIAPITAALAYQLLARRWTSWLAGVLAVFPIFYLPYLPTTDTFVLMMLLGAGWLWLAAACPLGFGSHRLEGRAYMFTSALILGVISGLMHLARADGLVWVLLAVATIFIWRDVPVPGKVGSVHQGWDAPIARLLLLILGYFLVMAPWMGRNQAVFGSLLAPGGVKALWFVDYDDLYIYPASLLTPQRWLDSGLSQIAGARLWALGQNLQTSLAVQGGIAMVPLVIWGLWRCRKQRLVQIGLAAWSLLLVIMTIPFPFAGARGGFFHSGAALQPLFWAAIPAGLQGLIDWGISRRGWKTERAMRMFVPLILALAIILSGFVTFNRVWGPDRSQIVWDASSRQYYSLGDELSALGADSQAVLLVNNPPGMYLSGGRPTVAIPDGGTDSLLAVAEKFHVSYLILEANHPAGLDDLYLNPVDQGDLHYLKTVAGAHLFEIYTD